MVILIPICVTLIVAIFIWKKYIKKLPSVHAFMYGDERRANIEAGIDVAKIDMELAKKTDEIDQAKAKKSRKQLNNFEKEVPE